MLPTLYTFDGQDITFNIMIQFRAVIRIIMRERNMNFEDAACLFYNTRVCSTCRRTHNALWAESAEYIADRVFEEIGA